MDYCHTPTRPNIGMNLWLLINHHHHRTLSFLFIFLIFYFYFLSLHCSIGFAANWSVPPDEAQPINLKKIAVGHRLHGPTYQSCMLSTNGLIEMVRGVPPLFLPRRNKKIYITWNVGPVTQFLLVIYCSLRKDCYQEGWGSLFWAWWMDRRFSPSGGWWELHTQWPWARSCVHATTTSPLGPGS